MKKLMLSLAGMLFISLIGVNAQDTTNVSDPTLNKDQQIQSTQPQPKTQTEQANYQRDLVRVQSSDVPASLRSTLQGTEYKGWENGTVYRNKTTNEYSVEVGEGTNRKTYRFDRNGKRVGNNNNMPEKQ